MLRFGVKLPGELLHLRRREQGLNILLAVIGGVIPLGIWTFTNRIFQLPSLAFNSLYVVGFPAMSNVIARGEDVRPLLLRSSAAPRSSGRFIFATFAAASPKLIPAVFGDQWADAAAIIPLICLSTVLLGSISVAASSYLPAVGRPGIVAVASAALGVVWIGITAALLPVIGVAAIGIGNLAGAIIEAADPQRRDGTEAPTSPRYRPLLRPLSVAFSAGAAGWLLCTLGPAGLPIAVAAGALTLALNTAGLMLTCRADLHDTVRLALWTVRSVVPRVKRPSGRRGDCAAWADDEHPIAVAGAVVRRRAEVVEAATRRPEATRYVPCRS